MINRPKTEWQEGEWHDEPDNLEWVDEATGYSCWASRNMVFGYWCAYVNVPRTHDVYGEYFRDIKVKVHGGVSFTGLTQKGAYYRIGFDCMQETDIAPNPIFYETFPNSTYKNLSFVKNECTSLARQLKELEKE
jgi:hypothetical protein